MSYSTSVFVYTQRQYVIIQSGFSPRIYMPQYAKPLTLHKGVDNQIQFQFLNQEQRPVDITGAAITCRIISNDGNAVLLTTTLNLQLPLTGIATLNLGSADIEDIDAQKCYYSLEFPVGNLGYPVFVDQNAGARGDMNIVNSVLPAFVPSSYVTIPTGQPFPNTNPNIGPANANTYYTSVISTDDSPVLTLQATYDEFVGNVTIEGSCLVDADWYPITTVTYSNVSNTVGYVVHGYHPYVRMSFTSNGGGVTNILSR